MAHWENEPGEMILARLLKMAQEDRYSQQTDLIVQRVRADVSDGAGPTDEGSLNQFIANHEQDFNDFMNVFDQMLQDAGEFVVGRSPTANVST
jgi:hypothetical protein